VNNNAFLKLRPLAGLTLLGLLCISCASGCRTLENQPPLNQSPLRAASDNGVTLSCSLPPATKVGHEIPLLVFLSTTNFNSPRCYVDLQSHPRLSLVILDSKGREVPKTDHGQDLIESQPGKSSKIYVDRIFRPYTPANELPRWTLNLNDLFVLTAGKYTAQISLPIATFDPPAKFSPAITNLNFEVLK
jgi:hypothetical protein